MQIKKDLLSHMEANHPDFKFAWAKSIFYNFRRIHEDGLYDFIFFQRDGKSGALAVEVATTYDPLWKGCGVGVMGKNTGLAYLKFGRSGWIEVERNWYTYNNSKTELKIVLAEISGDLRLHAMNYFERSAQALRSDELLHFGFTLLERMRLLDENERLQLVTEWKSGRLFENHLYQKYEAELHEFAARAGIPSEHVRKYAVDMLFYL
jgi:hypothetical protein